MIEDFETFLRFESVSSEPSYQKEVRRCADWVKEYLDNIGMETEVWEGKGHPIVFGQWLGAGKDQPTLLIYQHYDVQPVDPIEKWKYPPFEPTLEGDTIYARGAVDNKGQCFSTLMALKEGNLPINVKIVVEGEEEVGSLNFESTVAPHQKKLAADYVAVIDSGMKASGKPMVTLGVRGIVTFDVTAKGSHEDLHSGGFGGVAFNPIHALIHIFSQLRDPKTGEVKIPGFYEGITPLTENEKETLDLSFDQGELQALGVVPTGGEVAYTPGERNLIRPTLEVNGIQGGYTGKGFKTVIPAAASAKVSCRLVPGQDPHQIAKLVKQAINTHTPEGISINVEVHEGAGEALWVSPDSKIVKAFAKAYTEVFNTPCSYSLMGGTIPITAPLARMAGGEVAIVGLGLATDACHAPNERYDLTRLKQGAVSLQKALHNLQNPSTPS